MQRIAWGACLIAAALSGCARPARVSERPLPGPLLRTHHPPPHVVVPAPPPQPPAPGLRPGLPSVRLDERELIPPGGIRSGRWRVIVVHHSGNTVDSPASMDAYHRNVRGWEDGLGYHFVIGNGVNTEDGRVYVGPRWQRQITGAHCKSKRGRYFGVWRDDNFFNAHGIGICLVGNFEERPPTPRQLAALSDLIAFLCARTGISTALVYGHGDVTHRTQCPGRYLRAALPQVRLAATRTLTAQLADGLAPRD